MVEWLPDRIGDYDPYKFFHTWRAQFCSDATSEFEIASSRLALGVRPFFVTGLPPAAPLTQPVKREQGPDEC